MAILPQDPAKQKQLLIGLLPLLLLFVFYYFLHTPKVAEIEQLEARLEALEQRNVVAKAIAERSGPELEQRLAIYEQHMERLEQLIPTREEVPGLLNSVTARAQQAGVELAGYRPAGEEPGDHYSRQVYEISVTGGYHSIGGFLSAIGSLPRIITPTSLALVPNGDVTTRDGAQQLIASFKIETYILPSRGPASAELPNPGMD